MGVLYHDQVLIINKIPFSWRSKTTDLWNFIKISDLLILMCRFICVTISFIYFPLNSPKSVRDFCDIYQSNVFTLLSVWISRIGNRWITTISRIFKARLGIWLTIDYFLGLSRRSGNIPNCLHEMSLENSHYSFTRAFLGISSKF